MATTQTVVEVTRAVRGERNQQMKNVSTVNAKPSSALVTEWSGLIDVGIYNRCKWSIRLYGDRAVVRMPGVKWVGNTGGYHVYRARETGAVFRRLLCLAAEERADEADYSERALEAVTFRGI